MQPAGHSNAPTGRTGLQDCGQARRWRERRPALPAARLNHLAWATLRQMKAGVVHGKSAVEAGSQSVLRIERDRTDEGGCAISAGAKQVRNEWQSGGQPGAELADPVRLRISAGEDGGVRDHRQRRLGVGLLENHALARQAIEIRGESCFRARKPMRSARVESRVMRTMFGLPAAPRGKRGHDNEKRKQKCRNNPPEHTVKSTAQARELDARGRVARAATRACLTSTIMEARITAYLALSTNPEPWPRPAGVRRRPGLLLSCQPRKWHGDQKLIILGIDGMDPQLLKQFMAEGKMPNFSALAAEGIVPPAHHQHSAAEPGGVVEPDHRHERRRARHLRFHPSRSQDSAAVLFRLARGAAEARHSSGNWVIPLGGGSAEQLRQGKAFWEMLDDHGVPNTIFRMPSNFPPVKAKGNTLSGMGTPDLRGSYGTFSFYTDDPMTAAGAVEGGQIIPVQVEDSQVTAKLIGPDNTFRKGSPPALEPFTVSIDPLEAGGQDSPCRTRSSCCAKESGATGSTSSSS